jgi:hypothetical protein
MELLEADDTDTLTKSESNDDIGEDFIPDTNE